MTSVVLIGSECTGKSTLAAEIAARYGAPLSLEYARAYVAHKAAPLDERDVEPIARGQMAEEDRARAAATSVVVKDTDLVSTVVYAQHYYGRCPTWIERAARDRLATLYLLLHPDVPWLRDGLQRDRPHLRNAIHAAFERVLDEWGAARVAIAGPWDVRQKAAMAAIDRQLVVGSW